MKTWKLLSGVALVFAVGILVGALGTLFLRHHYPPPLPPPGPKAAFLLERLSKDLHLTEEQKKRVKVILERTDGMLHEHFQREWPQIEKILDDGFLEIGKELTDDQREKFRALRQRFERHR
jgi:hypothetical protein